MSDLVMVALIAGGFGLGVPIIGYWQWRRAHSGQIRPTAAETLWAEVNAMKDEYKAQVVALREQLSDLTVVCAGLRERIVECERRTLECQEREVDLMRELAELKGQKW